MRYINIQKLSLKTKLTLIVGFITTVVATIAVFFIVQIVFYSIESQIKRDLIKYHGEIQNLAKPEKSTELANYLRTNDLSLYIFDDKKEAVAKYGIYRNLDSKTLSEFVMLPQYIDKQILNFGEYDIYTSQNIQVATKNNVLYILKKSFYLSLLILLPIVWIISSFAAAFATNVVLSPLLKAKNISHELKNPLARVASSLQVLIDDTPKNIKEQLNESAKELIQLGGNVDSILSLSLFKKSNNSENFTNIKRELDKLTKIVPKAIELKTKISPNLIIPVDSSYINIIFRNLIDNACRYNIKKGYIEIIATKKLTEWSFAIKNSTAKKPSKKGYGLGMIIVEDICHNQNIKMEINNVGNIFSVKLVGKL